MLWFYRWLKGYVKVLFYGENAEKILNLCAKNRISLWNSRLVKTSIETNIYIKDFYKLKSIMFSSGIKLKILKKSGLLLKAFKNRKRLGIIVGIILFFAILRFMSGYVWIIDVVGNKTVSREEILADCKSIGITSGVKVSSIDPKTDRERLLIKSDKLAWASLNIEGSKLTVNVSEVKEEKSENTPANLKAKTDGIIEKIDITAGNCVVKAGDTVKQGDILVSGILERADSTEFVRAQGTVMAKTKREITVSGEYIKNITAKTGEKKNKKVLRIFSLYIPLYLGQETKEYIGNTNVEALRIFGQPLPIEIYSKEFEFVKEQTLTLSEDELCAELNEKLKDKLAREDIKDYTVESEEYIKTDSGITLKAIITAKENIAIGEEILLDNQSLE